MVGWRRGPSLGTAERFSSGSLRAETKTSITSRLARSNLSAREAALLAEVAEGAKEPASGSESAREPTESKAPNRVALEADTERLAAPFRLTLAPGGTLPNPVPRDEERSSMSSSSASRSSSRMRSLAVAVMLRVALATESSVGARMVDLPNFSFVTRFLSIVRYSSSSCIRSRTSCEVFRSLFWFSTCSGPSWRTRTILANSGSLRARMKRATSSRLASALSWLLCSSAN